MAKSIAQAEAELKAAALKFAAAQKAYCNAFERNRDFERPRDEPMHPDTDEKCRLSNEACEELRTAATELAECVAAERRAEAL